MRKMMMRAVTEMIEQNEDTALLLIDIGAFPLRNLIKEYPNRVKNIGIFEQGTVGIAAGMALAGMVPTIYGISPFIVQRSLEQLKLDFVYQQVGGNFITTGASYDFSTLGYSHYCAEDVATLRNLPGMEILTPGTPEQFEVMWNACWNNGKPSYFRMTDHCNHTKVDVEYGKAAVVKRGSRATVVVFAEQLDASMEACADLDVTILYYTTAAPFDRETLQRECCGGRVFVVSPFYEGSLYPEIIAALSDEAVRLGGAEVPLQVLRSYGTKEDKDAALGLDAPGIRSKLLSFLGD